MPNTAKEIETKKSNQIVSLGTNAKKITALGRKFKDLIISDTKTYESTKHARTTMVSVRTGIAKALITANKPHKNSIELNKGEAARLTALAKPIEDELQETVKFWESEKTKEKAEKERKEQERIQAHKNTINKIIAFNRVDFNASSDDVRVMRDELGEIVIDESLEEFEIEAKEAFDAADFILDSALEGATDREFEAEKLKIEQEELAIEKEKLESAKNKLADEQAKIDAEKKKLVDAKAERKLEKFLSKWDEAIEINFMVSWHDAISLNLKVDSERLAAAQKARKAEAKKQKKRDEQLQKDHEESLIMNEHFDMQNEVLQKDKAIFDSELAHLFSFAIQMNPALETMKYQDKWCRLVESLESK